ncbi:MAG: Crp/Fnr family transcriptional regulator [Acidobacteria bacterium]|nr:MAG: Crp/Fnr family transcriptional regulator [Acidobacteriota bacterium]
MRSPNGLEMTEHCATCKIRSSSFFCDLNPPAVKTLDQLRFTSGYPQGALLFVEGDSPRGVFILCRGRVKLSVTSSQGKTLILRIVHPGEVLGLNAAVSGKPYQATAETLDNCQIAFVKREDFLRLLQEHKEASVRAAQQLSSSYQTALGQLRSLGLSHSAPEKLARFLLDWAGQGQDSKHGIRARLTLTQEEIGQIIGTSRETVSRMFSEFRTSQLATMKGSTLIIQDRAALEKLTAT